MVKRISGILLKAGNTVMARCHVGALVALLGIAALFASVQADARPVQFHYVGGRWSHSRHAGWHRYWGGPSIGFYYAPAPVYVVYGYDDPYYYDGPDFWYSRPSFGLSINIGGGGYYGGRRYYEEPRYYRVRDHYSGGAVRWHDGGHSSYGHSYGRHRR